MVTQYGKDSAITEMVDKYDWYFFPNVNPDGYEYSHDYVSILPGNYMKLRAHVWIKLFE